MTLGKAFGWDQKHGRQSRVRSGQQLDYDQDQKGSGTQVETSIRPRKICWMPCRESDGCLAGRLSGAEAEWG